MGRRALAALAGGVVVFVWSISVSYWNWYKFPTSFTVAALIEQVIGWMLAGLVIALVLRGQRAEGA